MCSFSLRKHATESQERIETTQIEILNRRRASAVLNATAGRPSPSSATTLRAPFAQRLLPTERAVAQWPSATLHEP